MNAVLAKLKLKRANTKSKEKTSKELQQAAPVVEIPAVKKIPSPAEAKVNSIAKSEISEPEHEIIPASHAASVVEADEAVETAEEPAARISAQSSKSIEKEDEAPRTSLPGGNGVSCNFQSVAPGIHMQGLFQPTHFRAMATPTPSAVPTRGFSLSGIQAPMLTQAEFVGYSSAAPTEQMTYGGLRTAPLVQPQIGFFQDYSTAVAEEAAVVPEPQEEEVAVPCPPVEEAAPVVEEKAEEEIVEGEKQVAHNESFEEARAPLEGA